MEGDSNNSSRAMIVEPLHATFPYPYEYRTIRIIVGSVGVMGCTAAVLTVLLIADF